MDASADPAIAAHPFEHPDQALDFNRRLARDRGWSLAFLLTTAQTPTRTRLGKAVLASYRERDRRATGAPRARTALRLRRGDRPGGDASAGTHLADLGRSLRVRDAGGSGGDRSGSGGGRGGGGGD